MDDMMKLMMARLALCVEACDGVDPADLKPGLVKQLLTPPKRVRKRKAPLAQAAE